MNAVTASQEEPLWIKSDGESVFAVVTHPAAESGVGVLLLPGGGWMPSTMRNGMYVTLARRLAASGTTVLRLDYRGVGESTGATPFFDFMRPARSDVEQAVRVLHEFGCMRIVLVGSCFGGRTALAATPGMDELAGVVLSAVPVEDYGGASQGLGWHVRRALSRQTFRQIKDRYPKYLRIIRTKATTLLRPRPSSQASGGAASDDFAGPLVDLLERKIPCLIMHGRRDRHYPAFERALAGELGRRIGAVGDESLTIDVFDGELHGELTVESQRFATDRIESFIEAVKSAQVAGNELS